MADKEMMVKSISGGWVLVRLDTGSEVSLPEYCHVRLHKSANGHDIITIQEGPHAKKGAASRRVFGRQAARPKLFRRSSTFVQRPDLAPGRPAVKPVTDMREWSFSAGWRFHRPLEQGYRRPVGHQRPASMLRL